MNGDPGQRLAGELQDWANGNGVTLQWTNDTMRIVSADTTVRAVLRFPAAFWPQFGTTSSARQEDALASIVSDVFCQFDAGWAGPAPKEIDIPMGYLQGV
ncbi:MAG: hypothetical protein ACXWC2_16735 [Ramlibacter sp.]